MSLKGDVRHVRRGFQQLAATATIAGRKKSLPVRRGPRLSAVLPCARDARRHRSTRGPIDSSFLYEGDCTFAHRGTSALDGPGPDRSTAARRGSNAQYRGLASRYRLGYTAGALRQLAIVAEGWVERVDWSVCRLSVPKVSASRQTRTNLSQVDQLRAILQSA